MKKETMYIHGAQRHNEFGAEAEPIYRTSTFIFKDVNQGANRFAGKENGYIYGRLGNPTLTTLENKIALLEGTEACAVTASGMGAIASTMWTFLKKGDHLLADTALYGCTFALFTSMLTKFGVEVTLVDFDNIENVKKSIKKNTTIVYFETPCNPTLKVIDIEKVSKLVHQYNKKIKVIVDNTFCSPATQLPRKFGADLIVHSITKFINGHGDLIAGCVCGSQTDIAKVKMEGIKDATGSVMSADDAYMILRGLKTLGIRYDRQSENTLKIAQYLEKSPYVKAVNYPGLESSKYYDLCKKQMSKPCAILSFETSLSFEQTKKFVNNLKVITLAVSLGGVESLIEHPASMTHATYTKEALKKANIALTLIRLAVGIENVDDLINDLEQAFKKAKK